MSGSWSGGPSEVSKPGRSVIAILDYRSSLIVLTIVEAKFLFVGSSLCFPNNNVCIIQSLP